VRFPHAEVGTIQPIPCFLPALRKLGYWWKSTTSSQYRGQHVLHNRQDDTWVVVYWNGDGHDVRLTYRGQPQGERNVPLYGRGRTPRAIRRDAMALMAELRAEAERLLVLDPEWVVVPPRGGDAHQRRVARREVARLQAQARAQVRRGEGGEPKVSRQGALFAATKKVEKS
jgi:hypothetical protein